jgi:ureidoacrylate peracid hydrolase
MTEFPIIPAKTALLYFDTYNKALHPADPAAAAAVEASGIIPAMVKIYDAARAAGIAVFYAQADHRSDAKDFAPLIVDVGHDGSTGSGPRRTEGNGVHAGEWEVQVADEIAPQPGDYIIKKHRWSSFYQTHLELSLRTAGIDTILLCGGATEVGVASTAYAARDRDFNQVILKDACRSSKPGVDEFFTTKVFPIFARVMTVDETIAAIQMPATAAV